MGVARYDSYSGRAMLFLAFIWFIWFMSFASRTIFSPLLPLIEDEFHIAHARATSVYSFVAMGYAFSLFFSGFFASIFGYRKAIFVSVSSSAIVFFLISTIRIFHFFYPLALLTGMAAGLYLPSIIPLITDYYEERLWGKTIGVHGSAPSLAILAAPFMALAILSFSSWRGVFGVFGIILLISALIFYFVTQEVGIEKTKNPFIVSILKKQSFWIMGVIWIFSAGCNLGLYLVIPLYLIKELSIDMEHANTIFGISRFGGAVITIAAGFFVDTFSLKKGIFLLTLFTGIFTILMSLGDIWFVKTALFFQAAVSPTVFVLGFVAVPKLFEKTERGQATGFIVTLGMIGTGIIPYFLGLCGDYISFRFGIAVLGILTTLSSGFIWFLKELE